MIMIVNKPSIICVACNVVGVLSVAWSAQPETSLKQSKQNDIMCCMQCGRCVVSCLVCTIETG